MTLNQLRYFLSVCDNEKIIIAAEQLHISEPSLSVSIKRLEEELGYPLFIRSRKNLSLTDEGKILREKAAKLIADFDRLEKEMLQLRKDSLVIRLSVSPFQGDYLCSKLISEFIKANPASRFDTPALSARDAIVQVENEDIEFAIINQLAIKSENVDFFPLFVSGICGYVRSDHPLAGKKDIPPEALADKKLILMGERSLRSKVILNWFSDSGVRPDILMYSTRRQLTYTMVKQSNAVALLGDESLIFNDSVQSPPEGIASFTLSPEIHITNGIIRKKNAALSREAKRFYDFCTHCDIFKKAGV